MMHSERIQAALVLARMTGDEQVRLGELASGQRRDCGAGRLAELGLWDDRWRIVTLLGWAVVDIQSEGV